MTPESESLPGQTFPRESPTRIDFPGQGDVAMPENIAARNPETGFQVMEKLKQAVDLDFGIGFVPCIVEFDADRNRVQIGEPTPIGLPRMPCAAGFIDQLIEAAVASDEVMGADFPGWIGQRPERPFDVVVAGIVENDEIGPPFVVVGRPDPCDPVRSPGRNAAATGQ